MARRATTARVVLHQGGYVRAECSDGYTYFALVERRRRRIVTETGRWPTGTPIIDRPVTWRDMPHAVRAIFRDRLPVTRRK